MASNPISRLKPGVQLKGGDLSLLLLSLLLAVLVWFISNLSRNYSSVMTVPVFAQSNLEGHSRDCAAPCDISARCRATGFRMLRGNSRPKVVTVFISPEDLHREGNSDVYHITAAELSRYTGQIYGEGVQLESFISPSVSFTFPVENYKKVPVQGLQALSFKPQYMAVAPMRFQPDSVIVYGEPMHLDNLDRIYTSGIAISNLSRDTQGVVKLECPRGVRLSESEVTYSISVSRYVELHSTVKIGVRNAPAGKDLTVFPSTAEVVYRCAFPLRANPVDAVSFAVDYRDFEKSINGRCIPKASRVPPGVIDYRIDPEVFECVDSSRR